MLATSSTCLHDATPCLHDTTFGGVKIQLNYNKDAIAKDLFIRIETKRLLIVSVNTTEYKPQLTALYGDKKVNKLVGTGGTLNAELVSEKIQRWINRWAACNPFSGYVIIERSTGDFVGQIGLKPVKDKSAEKLNSEKSTFLPGLVEIGYLSMEKHWKKGYGKEYTHAIINHLLPYLIKQDFQVNGHPVKSLMATARCDNVASNGILRFFMRFTGERERYGCPRMWYQQEYTDLGEERTLDESLCKT